MPNTGAPEIAGHDDKTDSHDEITIKGSYQSSTINIEFKDNSIVRVLDATSGDQKTYQGTYLIEENTLMIILTSYLENDAWINLDTDKTQIFTIQDSSTLVDEAENLYLLQQ